MEFVLPVTSNSPQGIGSINGFRTLLNRGEREDSKVEHLPEEIAFVSSVKRVALGSSHHEITILLDPQDVKGGLRKEYLQRGDLLVVSQRVFNTFTVWKITSIVSYKMGNYKYLTCKYEGAILCD